MAKVTAFARTTMANMAASARIKTANLT